MAAQFGLNPDRFAVVDAELRRVTRYFEQLRDEIDAAAPANQAG